MTEESAKPTRCVALGARAKRANYSELLRRPGAAALAQQLDARAAGRVAGLFAVGEEAVGAGLPLEPEVAERVRPQPRADVHEPARATLLELGEATSDPGPHAPP